MSVSIIAEKAGVSIATVSRVLNNSRRVNPKMAELVHRAMEELQLPARQPRRRTRSRNSDRHATIAIVSLGQGYHDWFGLPVIASVVAELTRAAQDQEMGVLMAEMPDPTQLSPVLRRPDVDGALVFINSELSTKDVAVLREYLPIVRVMGGQLAPVEIDHIGADNNAIGYVAAEHLLKQGLTELAFLTSKPNWDFSKLRAQGFMAAAEEAGITPTMYLEGGSASRGPGDQSLGTPLGSFGPRAVVEADLPRLVSRLAREQKARGADAESPRAPLGLFVSRDDETVHVYRLLRENGLEPGRDIVVVSCDNETVRLSTLHPRPATIDLNPAQLARHAVRRLAARIKHRDEPAVRILVNPHLVPGDVASV